MSEPRSSPALDRAARYLQLVPYLIAKGEVSISEAAAEFDVAPEEMRGMVEKLTVLGLPGDGGFWQLPHDLFDIDWDLLSEHDLIQITNTVGLERAPRLTAREAAALLAGLQLAASLPGVSNSSVVQGLLSKLARGASSTPADVVIASAPVDNVRIKVNDALREGVSVSFSYKAPDAHVTRRVVDPTTVLISNGQWYLQGWCHLRQAMRTFHLDRVSDLELTSTAAKHLGATRAETFTAQDTDVAVRVRYLVDSTPLLGDYLDHADVEIATGTAVATIRVADIQSLKRLAARLGGAMEILDPPVAREAAVTWALAGRAQYT